eukprot:5832290-Amphidinium_carterae.2
MSSMTKMSHRQGRDRSDRTSSKDKEVQLYITTLFLLFSHGLEMVARCLSQDQPQAHLLTAALAVACRKFSSAVRRQADYSSDSRCSYRAPQCWVLCGGRNLGDALNGALSDCNGDAGIGLEEQLG